MDITMITEYVSPAAMIAALGVGYIVKNLIPSEKINRFIPLVAALVGIAVCTGIDIPAGNFGVNTIIVGMISGLASTGMYEAFRNTLGGKIKTKAAE